MLNTSVSFQTDAFSLRESAGQKVRGRFLQRLSAFLGSYLLKNNLKKCGRKGLCYDFSPKRT